MRRPAVRTLLAAAMVGVALLALALAAVLTGPLLRDSTESTARAALARDALLLSRVPSVQRMSTRPALSEGAERQGVSIGFVGTDGSVRGAATALDDADRQALLAQGTLSTEGTLAGEPVLIEGRRLRDGSAVVLAGATSGVDETVARQRRRLLLALGLGLVAAVAAAALVARSLSRPLAGLASTARLLTGGQRGVAPPAPATGPHEVLEVADALHRLDHALTGSEQRQRRFLLSVSHELRTPLTAIRGYAEALADGTTESEELPEIGSVLVQESERMERYIADLLALGRLEADDFTLALVDADLTVLLIEAAQAWAARFERAGLTLSVEATPPLPVRTDPGRVRQVLDVLTDNALQAGAAGVHVVWAATGSASGVRLEVRDSGPGLAEADARDAFEPGVLHDRYADRRPSGHGLGLAIAHRLVSRLGGTIELERAPEGGASFVVTLPPSRREDAHRDPATPV